MFIKQIKYSLFVLIFVCIGKANAQPLLTGPVCVLRGLVYQYEISNKGTDTSLRLCITGGVIAGTTSTCTETGNFSDIRVNWTDSVGGYITLTFGSDSTSITVFTTKVLNAGAIDSASMIQTVIADSIPPSIHCTGAFGGSCNPLYNYQWEQSPDGITWIDMTGATATDLIFTSAISQTTYFRRRVTETNGNSIGLSLVAVIIVQQPNP